MNLRWIGIALVASIGPAQSQTEPSTPKFEVISVKPNKTPDLCKGLLQWLPEGRFVGTNVPLMRIVSVAWGLPMESQRLALAPGVKMPDEIYDIEATPQEGTFQPTTTNEVRFSRMKLMVQALLEDRFRLKVRHESKDQPVYALVVGKGRPQLEKSKFQEPTCSEEVGPKLMSNPACHWLDGGQDAGLHGASVTIAQIVDYLNDFTDRPLFDKTGLTGYYNIQTEGWAPMRPPVLQRCGTGGGNVAERPSLFEVLEKLGLRLESQRAVIDMFVIEHVERPGEN